MNIYTSSTNETLILDQEKHLNFTKGEQIREQSEFNEWNIITTTEIISDLKEIVKKINEGKL